MKQTARWFRRRHGRRRDAHLRARDLLKISEIRKCGRRSARPDSPTVITRFFFLGPVWRS